MHTLAIAQCCPTGRPVHQHYDTILSWVTLSVIPYWANQSFPILVMPSTMLGGDNYPCWKWRVLAGFLCKRSWVRTAGRVKRMTGFHGQMCLMCVCQVICLVSCVLFVQLASAEWTQSCYRHTHECDLIVTRQRLYWQRDGYTCLLYWLETVHTQGKLIVLYSAVPLADRPTTHFEMWTRRNGWMSRESKPCGLEPWSSQTNDLNIDISLSLACHFLSLACHWLVIS